MSRPWNDRNPSILPNFEMYHGNDRMSSVGCDLVIGECFRRIPWLDFVLDGLGGRGVRYRFCTRLQEQGGIDIHKTSGSSIRV